MKQRQKGRNISLCLSGGGFRATYFHLGMIDYLRSTGRLSQVKNIYAVSGGSITAAFLVLNWDRFTGTQESYEKACAELVHFGQRDLRGRIIRRWILFSPLRLVPFIRHRFSRLGLLQRYYDHLFNKAVLRDLAVSPQQPALKVLSTSMTTGNLCSFDSAGVEVTFGGENRRFTTQLVPLSFAVAASSAFPPMFPPLELKRKDINASAEKFQLESDFLTDGGVYDNLGIRKLMQSEPSETGDRVCLISDASGAFDWNPDSSFSFVFDRTIRTTDILMKRVADLEADNWSALAGPGERNLIYVGISNVVSAEDHGDAQTSDVQKAVAQIRTDLDSFSDIEVTSLIRHGHEVARKELDPSGQDTPLVGTIAKNYGQRRLTGGAIQRSVNHLRRSRRRRFGLFNRSDPASWAISLGFLIFAALPLLPAYVVNQSRLAAVEETKQLRDVIEGFSEPFDVSFATSRTYNPAARRFTGQMASLLTYGRATVALPPDYDFSPIEMNRAILQDPRNIVGLININETSLTDFQNLLAVDDADRQGGVLIYVHDFNTSLGDSIKTTAYLNQVLELNGKIVLFSWPSAESVMRYSADALTAERSATHLAGVIHAIKASGYETINVMGAGLGGDLVAAALPLLESAADEAPLLDEVVFLWPHRDSVSLEETVAAAADVAGRFTLYTTQARWVRSLKVLSGEGNTSAQRQTKGLTGINTINVQGDIWPIDDLRETLAGTAVELRRQLKRGQDQTWSIEAEKVEE
ncbi:alpha/beta hydrolase [Rhodobacteraceae bacterium S2214]|nr:alpha/beta hydrolase [Rhodobacteraceae bacterium S2214]